MCAPRCRRAIRPLRGGRRCLERAELQEADEAPTPGWTGAAAPPRGPGLAPGCPRRRLGASWEGVELLWAASSNGRRRATAVSRAVQSGTRAECQGPARHALAWSASAHWPWLKQTGGRPVEATTDQHTLPHARGGGWRFSVAEAQEWPGRLARRAWDPVCPAPGRGTGRQCRGPLSRA